MAEEDRKELSHTVPQAGVEVGAQVGVGWAVDKIVGAVLANRYEVRAIIGRGGMGIVVRAFDRTLATDVAVKLLRPELMPERRWAERLAREVKLARQIHHPNVCRVFDFEQADGFVFLVMELAVGTLAQEIVDGTLAGRPIEDRMAEAKSIVAGLAAIHAAGIVHGDVTPQNVLRMSDGRLVVSDFGLARELVDTATIHGGTVAYMAPEVMMGSPVSFSSDVWSLGIVIHEMLFGVRPQWRRDAPGRVDRPANAAHATERRAFDLVRAFTTADATRRPHNAIAARELFERPPRRSPRLIHALLATTAVAAVTAAAAYGVPRIIRKRTVVSAGAKGPDAIEVTGDPDDWSRSSRLVASVPGQIRCLVALPDKHTVRFVWGYPPQAADVDVRDGRRTPSPLVPKAYAEGCPDLASDGKLIFQGYDDRGRPMILRSPHPDGRDADPVTPAVEPSLHSEPKWLASGKVFVFDVDWLHVGLYEDDHVIVLPLASVGQPDDRTLVRFSYGDDVYLNRSGSGVIRVEGIHWPDLKRVADFTVAGYSLSWQAYSHGTFFFSEQDSASVVEVQSQSKRARRIGHYPGQSVYELAAVEDGLAVVSSRTVSDAWRYVGRTTKRLTTLGDVRDAVACANGTVMVSRGTGYGAWTLHTVLADGSVVPRFDSQGAHVTATCSPHSNVWWISRLVPNDGQLARCIERTCTRVLSTAVGGMSVSPDERHLSFFTITTHRGALVQVMSTSTYQVRDISISETACRPIWATNHTLWVSRRIKGILQWTEVDIDDGQVTGRTMPGGKSCADGEPDPLSPTADSVRVVTEYTSELHLKQLPVGAR